LMRKTSNPVWLGASATGYQVFSSQSATPNPSVNADRSP
jgi:hypothetical protein